MKHAIRIAAALCLLVALAGGGGRAAGIPGAEAAPSVSQFAAALFAPQNGYNVAGAIAVLGTTKPFTVAIAISGLQPGEAYPAQMQSHGACGGSGPVVAHLPAMTADSMGDIEAFTSLPGSTVPGKGYFVTVLGSGKGALPVACANLQTPDQVVSLASMNGSKASGYALFARYAPVTAVMEQVGTQVVVVASGLQPSRPQEDHIHAGRCGTLAPVRYTLLTLVADGKGRAIGGTGIPDIVPKTGLSVHIHDDTFKVIACGNVGP